MSILAKVMVAALVGLALGGQASASNAPVDVQGHRGARGLLPENTLEGFARAIELGVTTLELDTGMTADGVVVVAHDPTLSLALCRGPALPSLQISMLRYDEITGFDCSLNPDIARFPEPPRRNPPGARIPRLGEVLTLAKKAARPIRLNIEVKVTPDEKLTRSAQEMTDAVVTLIQTHQLVERSTLQSFDWRVLRFAKQREPMLKTVGLVEPRTLDPRWLGGKDPKEYPDLLSLVRDTSFVNAFSPSWQMLLEPQTHPGISKPVSEWQAAGIPVVPWTANDESTIRRLLELGVEGIISDYPDRAMKIARELGRPVR